MSNYSWTRSTAPVMTNGGRTDDIWFVDGLTGWAVNSSGQVLVTRDGARTWEQQAQFPKVYLRCVTFSSAERGWIGTTTPSLRILRTVNGGADWTPVANLPREPSAICGIWAWSDKTIYAAGTNWPNRPTAVIRTTDGGETWSGMDMRAHASLLVDIYFRDAAHGWVVGGGAEITATTSSPLSFSPRTAVRPG